MEYPTFRKTYQAKTHPSHHYLQVALHTAIVANEYGTAISQEWLENTITHQPEMINYVPIAKRNQKGTSVLHGTISGVVLYANCSIFSRRLLECRSLITSLLERSNSSRQDISNAKLIWVI